MTVSLLRNLLSNWMGLAAAAILGFIVAPIIVHSLGKEQFGLMALAAAVSSQLVLLDFGVRQALVRAFARARIARDDAMLCRYGSAGLLLNVVAAVTSMFVATAIGAAAATLFTLPENSVACFQVLLALYAIDAAVHLALGTGEAGLSSAERFDVINLITVVRQVIYSIIVVAALSLGFGVKTVVVIGALCRIGQRIAAMCALRSYLPTLRFHRGALQREAMYELIRYGGWASALIVALRIIYHIDEIVCGLLLGVHAVATYAVAVIVAEQIRTLYQASSTVLTPRLTGLFEREDVAGIEVVVRGWYAAGVSLGTLTAVPLITYAPSFVALWMGPDFSESGRVIQILAASFIFLFPAAHFIQILYAANEHHLAAKVLLTEAVINVALSLLLGRMFGVSGIALGTLLPALFIRGWVLPRVVSSGQGMSFPQFVHAVWFRGAATALVLLAIGQWLLQHLPGDTWTTLIIGVAVLLGVCTATLYIFILREDDRRYLWRRLRGAA